MRIEESMRVINRALRIVIFLGFLSNTRVYYLTFLHNINTCFVCFYFLYTSSYILNAR